MDAGCQLFTLQAADEGAIHAGIELSALSSGVTWLGRFLLG